MADDEILIDNVWMNVDEKNEKVKETIRKKVSEYLGRMETLKKVLEERKNEPTPKKQATTAAGGGGSRYQRPSGFRLIGHI